MEPFIGQIVGFAGNFAPRNWALCQGQLLAIADNNALFSIIGTTFGGDGRTSFGLPDLRGRVMIGPGSGPGLPTYVWGERTGNPTTTLTVQNLPSHNHGPTLHAETATADSNNPQGRMLAITNNATTQIYKEVQAAADRTMAPESIRSNNVGSNTSFSNQPPSLAVNWIIALFGIFPSRS